MDFFNNFGRNICVYAVVAIIGTFISLILREVVQDIKAKKNRK